MGNCCSDCLRLIRGHIRPGESGVPLTPRRPKPPIPTGPTDLPKPPTEITPSDGSTIEDTVLVVEKVDLCAAENASSHYTEVYDLVQKSPPTLVVRRGQLFRAKVTFNRRPNQDRDSICLVFTVKDAPFPSYSQGSMVITPVTNSIPSQSDDWKCELMAVDDKTALINVTPSPKAIVGIWTVDVDTKIQKKDENDYQTLRYTVKEPIYILFNPWCQEDTVYLKNHDWRMEYVLNETGMIWRGSYNRIRPSVWNFGQFEEHVLECCCYLLSHIGKLPVVARSDPVKVSRHISAVVNSPDEDGVVEGNWSSDYSGGKPPTQWAGSPSILQQFYKTKKPVKFGQCWVFSGICTTVCRALGLPARSVTNYASAHDTHNSLTIDYFYDLDGEPVEKYNIDSVWNFHVWNEVWMDRPDLEPGDYGGWQAVDATPQEQSDGVFRCGPCSVKAVKRGEIQKVFDGPFLFAEVNADKVYWRYRGDSQPLKLIEKVTDNIGQFISTKAIGSFDREDITHAYKHKEHSKEEREVMLRALRLSRNAFSRYYLNDDLEDVEFDFRLLDDIVIGSSFSVKLTAKNKSKNKKEYSLNVVLRVATVLYTGQAKNIVKKDKFEVKIKPGVEEQMTMHVAYTEYEKELVDQGAFLISATAHVKETGFDYFAQDDFRVRMPDIKIETEGDIIQGQAFTTHAYFKNPLPKSLRKGTFTIEGPGLGRPLKLYTKGEVPPGNDARVSFQLTPKTSGEKTIVAKFHSKELDDVDGFKEIKVRPAEGNNVLVDGH